MYFILIHPIVSKRNRSVTKASGSFKLAIPK
jgi:hypothetical protein